jgi:hypothetical protein
VDQALQRALKPHLQAQDVLGEASNERMAGKLYTRCKQMHQAEQSLNRTLQLYRQAGSVHGEADVRFLFGKIHLRQDVLGLDEARETFQTSTELYQQAQDPYWVGKSKEQLKSIVARRNREIALRAECKQSLYK